MTYSRRITILLSLLALSGCSGGDTAAKPVPEPPPDLLASTARVDQGRALFVKHCALCHGERGDGHGRRRNLSQPPRDLTDPSWQAQMEPREVYRAIRYGVPRTPMAAWSVLSEDEIWSLVAFIGSLDEGGG